MVDITANEFGVYLEDFNNADANGNGALDPEEIRLLLTHQLGQEPTENECAAFIASVDQNEDGRVSLFEYIREMVGGSWTLDGQDLMSGLKRLRIQLKELELANMNAFGVGLQQLQLQTVEKFNLDVKNCRKLLDLAGLSQAFGKLPALQKLRLDLNGCGKLSDISGLAEGLRQLGSLQDLTLIFRRCEELSNVTTLGQALGEMQALQELNIDFTGCETLSDISGLAEGLRQMGSLQDLKLVFSRCDQLEDVTALWEALAEVKARRLSLDFTQCRKLSNMDALKLKLEEQVPNVTFVDCD